MKIVKAFFSLLAIAVFCAGVSPGVRADTENKKTIITFSQPVEVPGKVLPAGTYTFQLLDSPADRHIVQIFNADGTQIVTTILAINNYRLEPKGETVMKFAERPGDAPDALRAWFYPGDNFGQEFVYPKARAIQLAQSVQTAVPAVAAESIDDSSIKTIPIVSETPDQKEVELTTVIQTTPATAVVETPAPVAVVATPAPATEVATPEPAVSTVSAVSDAKEMPQTASSLPLIALLGGLSVSLALGLKLFLKLAS